MSTILKKIFYPFPLVLAASTLFALPEGEEIVAGRAEFHSSDGRSLKVIASDKAIINYQKFHIGKHELVEFVQPSSKSSVLNRVTGKEASKILGKLSSNGRLFLVNSQGIYFGPDAVVNTGSFIASTLNIRDEDFLQDKLHFFAEPGSEKSTIINHGMISSSPEGFIAFFAPVIENRGSILARAGKVVLAAAERVTLDFSGDGLIQFTVDGQLKNALIENYGNIEAASGAVSLSLQTARDAIKMVVNTDGITPANAIEESNGIIRLVNKSIITADAIQVEANAGSRVDVSGTLNASNGNAGQKGGKVLLLGDDIRLLGAQVDARGDAGGGTVLIGGDYQGKGPARNAIRTVVDENSLIYADALRNGDGGKVIVWADDTAVYDGQIFARGGREGGDGGFVETSGKLNLSVTTGNVTTLSPLGKIGTWMMDPSSITIVRNNGNQGTSGLNTAATCTGGGFNLNDTTINNAGSTVLLCTSGAITYNNNAVVNITTAGVGINHGSTGTPSNITFQTGGVSTWSIITNNGPLTFIGPVTIPSGDTLSLSTSGGSVAFNSTINGAGPATISAGSGNVTFTGAVGGTTALTSLSATGATITQSSTAKTTGALSYTGSTAINVNGNITTSGGIVTLTGPVAITGAPTFDSTNAGGTAVGANISFSSTLNGATALTLRAGTAGNVTFTGAVGGTTPLTNLSFTSANLIQVGNDITVTGANPLVFSSPVSLTGTSNITSNNANVTFSNTLNGAQALTIAGGSGTTTFTGAVGGTTPLTSLSATAATVTQSSTAKTTGALSYTGSTAINANGNITTSGGIITLTGPVAITGAPTFDSTNAGGTAAGANISFSSTLNGATALTLRAGTAGNVTFTGAVGGTAALTNLAFTSANLIQVGNNITVTGANPLVFPSPVSVTGTSTITSNNANVTFSSTLNGAQALTIAGGSGITTFTGAVGGTTPLTSLSATAATVTQSSTAQATGALSYTGSTAINVNGNITTSGGIITLTGPVAITGAPTFDSTNAGGTATGANISFSSTLNGATALTLRAGTAGNVTFSGVVGGTAPLTNLTFTSANLIQIGNNITVTGANPLVFPSPVSLMGTSNITSNNANITFSSTLNGANALTLTAGTGTVTFTGAVGGTTPLTGLNVASASLVQVGNNITVSGANPLVFSGPVSLTGTSTITSNNANVTFSSTLNGAQALTIAGGSGTTTFTGAIGGTTPLTSLSATAATVTQSSTAKTTGALSYTGSTAINVNGNITTSGGIITLTGPVAITGAPTFDSTNAGGTATGANISFSSTLNGATALTLRAGTAGNVTFTGAVGGTAPLTNLTFTSANLIQIGNNITVTGANPLVFSSPVSVTGTSNITSNNANITFSSTLNGANALTLTAGTGTVTFTGAVGGTTPLTGLNVASATLVQVGNNITVSGANPLVFSAPVSLTGTSNMTSNNANITFNSTLNGAQALTLTAGTGTVTFTGAVGGTTPLTNLSFASAGLIQVGNNITVSGANPLVFSGPVSLTGTSNMTSNNANITFSSTLNGAQALTLTAGTGTVTFTGAVGGTTPLTGLNVASASLVQVGNNITLSGANPLVFSAPVSLTGTSNMTSNNANITFSSTLNGAQALTLTAGTGTVTFTGVVGGTTPLTNLSFASAGLIQIGNSITVSGANPLVFSAPVSLTGTSNITSNNANITFSSTVNGANALTLTAGTGTVTFTGVVGGTTPLTNLNVASASLTQVGNNITVSGANPLVFSGPVSLTGNSNMTSNNANITFSSTLNGARALTLTAGTGTVTLTGAVGGTTPLTNLSFASAGLIQVGNNITVSGANPLVFPSPVSLTGNSTMTSNNANVTFSSTLNGARSLTIAAGTGTVTFVGAIGGITPLTSLSVTAATISQNSSAQTTGALSYTGSTAINVNGNITTTSGPITMTGPVTVSGSPTFDTTNGGTSPAGANITFSTTVTGSSGLTLNAGSGGTVTFGGSTSLTSLSISGFTVSQNSNIQLTGSLSYTGLTGISIGGNITTSGGTITLTGPVTISNNPTFDTTNAGSVAAGANISFSSTLNGATGLTLRAGTGGNLIFSGAIGEINALTNLVFTSTNLIRIGSNLVVSGANPLTFPFPVQVTGSSNVTSNGANITFNSTVNGDVALTRLLRLIAGSGSVVMTGAVGGTTPLAALAISSANNLTANAITAGAISQAAGTGTTTFNGALTTSGSLGISLIGQAFTFNNTVTTTGTGGVSIANSGLLSMPTAATFTLDGPLTQTGSGAVQSGNTVTSNNGISLASAVSLTHAASFSTAAASQQIAFLSSIDSLSTTPFDLTLNAGTSNITISGNVGSIHPLGIFQVVQTNNLTMQGLVANTAILSGGTGTTTVNGDVLVGSGGISLTGNNFINNGNATTTNGGSITISNTGTVTRTPGHTTVVDGNYTVMGPGPALAGSSLTVKGNVLINSAVTLASNATVNTSSGNGNITFNSTVDGARDLTLVAGTGNISLGANVGFGVALGNLTISSANTVTTQGIQAASIVQTTGTGSTSLNGALTTSGTLGVSINAVAITRGAAITTTGSGPVTITNSGTFTSTAAGAITAAGAFTQNGTGNVSLGGSITTANANISFASPVTLAASTSLNSGTGAGNITFSQTVQGAFDLTLNAGTGNVTLGGNVGTVTPLTALTITRAATVSTQAIACASITQSNGSGTTTFNGALSTTGASGIALTGTSFTFNAPFTTTGSGPVSITHTGLTQFGASATGSVAGSLTQIGAGTSQLSSTITAGGAMQFNGPFTVSGTGSLSTQAANQPITFFSTLNGPGDLTLSSGTGDLTFSAAAGGTTPLGALTISTARNVSSQAITASSILQSAGTGTTLFSGNLTTSDSGGINLSGAAFTFIGNATAGGTGAISIVNSGTLTTTLGTTLSGNGGFSQSGGGSVNLGSGVTTSNTNITFTNPITLTSNVILNSGTSLGDITVGTVDGNFNLTFTPGRDIFAGAIGSTTRVGTLTATQARDIHASSMTAAAIIQLAGTGTTTLAGNVNTNTAAGINLTGTNFVRSGSVVTTNGGSLVVTNSGLITGTSINTTSIDGSYMQIGVGPSARTNLAGTISARQGISLSSPITLLSDPLNLTPIILDSSSGNGNIVVSGTIDNFAAQAPHTLILRSGSGNTTLSASVGSTQPIGPLKIGNVHDLSVAALTLDSIQQEALTMITGQSTFSGAIATSGASGIVLSGNGLAFQNSVTVSGGGSVAITNSGTLAIPSSCSFVVDGSWTQSGAGGVSFGGSITTTNNPITFASPITLTAAASLNSGGGDITLNESVDGASLLTLTAGSGDISLFSPIGSVTPLAGMTIVSADTILIDADSIHSGPFTITSATGPTTFNGILTATSVSMTGAAINLNKTVTSTTGSIGIVNSGLWTVASMAPLFANTSLTQTGSGSVSLGSDITTAGTLSIASAITLTDNITLNSGGGNLILSNTVAGVFDLTLTAGTGNITLSGNVGAPRLGAFTITSANNISVQAITASSLVLQGATGTSFLHGSLDTDTMAGISLTGNVFISSGTVTTTNGGPFTLTNSGLATGTAASVITLNGGGAFTQNGTGPVNLGGSLTTQNGNISHSSPVSILLPTTITSNGGDITFLNTLNGPACLTLNAGTGDVLLSGVVGGITPLGCLDTTGATISNNQSVTTTGTMQETASAGIFVGGNLTTANSGLTLSGDVTTSSSITLSTGAGAGDISVSGTINGNVAGLNLTVQAGTGDVTLSDVLGGNNPFNHLTISGDNVSWAGLGTMTSGATGITSVTATTDLTFAGTSYNNGTQTYTAGNNFLFTAGAPVSILSNSLPIVFDTGTIQLGSSDLSITSFGGDITLTPLLGTGRDLTVNAEAGAMTFVQIGAFGDDLNTVTLTSNAFSPTPTQGTNVFSAILMVNSSTPQIISTNQTTGSITYNSPIIIQGNIIYSCGAAGTITFNNTVDAATPGVDSLIFDFNPCSGSLIFQGPVGATSPLAFIDIDSAANVTTNGAVTLGSFLISNGTGGTQINAGITATDSPGISISTSTINLAGAIVTQNSGSLILDNSGPLTIAPGTSINTSGAFQQVGAGSVTTSGSLISHNATIEFTGPVTLNGAAVFNSENFVGGDISFADTIQGAQNLTLQAGTGDVTLSGAVGTLVTPILNLQITSAHDVTASAPIFASTIKQLAGTGTTSLDALTTTGLNGINLTGTSFAFNGNVTTSNNGPLLINRSGSLTFANASYSIAGALTQSGAGTTTLAGSFTAGGAVSFASSVTLSGTTSINTSANSQNISFSSTLTNDLLGPHDLTLNAGSGNIVCVGAIGTTPIGALSISNVGTASLNAISATSIAQSAGTGTTTISGNLTTTGGSGISLTGKNFTITSTVTTTNSGPFSIANTGPLSLSLGSSTLIDGSFSQSGGGAVSLSGTLATNNQPLLFTNAISLSGATTLSSGAAAGNITLMSTVNGTRALTLIAGTGNILLSGNLGATTPLGALSVTSVHDVTYPTVRASSITQAASTGTTTISGLLNTTGILGVSITGGTINQNAAITTSNAGPVSFVNTGILTIAAPTTSSGAYTQSGGGSVLLGSSIDVSNNALFFSDPITLTAAVALTAGPTSSNGNDMTFVSSITGAQSLTLTSIGGTILFDADVGSVGTPLTALTILQAGDVSTQGVYANAITQSVGTGTTEFHGPINANGLSGISLTGTSFIFDGTITSGGQLALNNSALATFNAGATGSITGALTQNGVGATQLSSTLTVGGAVNFGGPFSALGTGSIDTQAANQPITFFDTVDGPGNLSLSSGTADILFQNDIGNTTRLDALTITTAHNLTTQDIRASSILQSAGSGLSFFQGNLDTNGSSGISISGTDLTFSGNLTTTGGGGITLTNSGDLTTTIGKMILSDGPFTQNGSGNVFLGNSIETSNALAANAAISFSGSSPITLTAPADIDSSTGGGTITFSAASTVNGAQPITLNAGTGDITILGNFGSITPVGAFTVVSVHDLQVQATTAGSFTQLAGTGTTSLLGALLTNAPGGIHLVGNNFTTGPSAMSITTTNGGSMTITNQGLIIGNAPIVVTIDGSFTQNGPGIIFVVPATARQGFSFSGPAIIALPVTLDSSAGNGDITFLNRISGFAGTEPLIFNAGSGNVTLAQPIGLTGMIGPFSVTAIGSLSATGEDLSIASIGDTLTAGVNGTTTLTASENVLFTGTTYHANTQTYTAPILFRMNAGALTTFTSGGSPLSFAQGGLLLSTGTDLTMNTGGSSLTLNAINAQAANHRNLILNTGAGSIQIGNLGTLNNGEFASASFTGNNLTLKTSFADAFTFNYTGTLTAQGNIVSTDTPLTFPNPVVLQASNLFSTVSSSGSNITFSSTLNGAVADTYGLTLNTGSGNITFSDNVGVTNRLLSMTISSANNVTLATSKSLRTDALVQSAGTGTTAFNGPLVVPGVLGISLKGNNFTFNSSVLTMNNGSLKVTNAGTLTFAGTATLSGAFTQNSATGPVALSGSITAGQPIAFSGPVTLSGTPTLSTAAANQTISFLNSVAGSGNLTLAAGNSGDILFSAAVGSSPSHIGTLTISTSHDVTFQSVFATSIGLLSSTGTTTAMGSLSTTGASGISLTGNAFVLNGALTTTGGGSFAITNSGLLSDISGSSHSIDGAYTQSGTGPVEFAGTLTTQNGAISFASPVSLNSASVFDSSAANQNITFSDAVDGPGSLSAIAGTGDISFNQAIGSDLAFATLTVSSAHDLNLNGVGLVASGVAGDLHLTASNTINLVNDIFTTGSQTYISGNGTNFNTGASTTLTTLGGSISFPSGTVTLSSGNDLTMITNNGDLSFLSIMGTNSEGIFVNTSGGSAALGAVSSLGLIHALVVDPSDITFSAPITADNITFIALGSIYNVGAPVLIQSPSTVFFNALGGNVGTVSSPIFVQTAGQIFAGADGTPISLAVFQGTSSDNTVHAIPSNPPCRIIFNNIIIKNCISPIPPTPTNPTSIPSNLPFAVPGFDSSFFNLSNDFFFFPYFFDKRYTHRNIPIDVRVPPPEPALTPWKFTPVRLRAQQ